MNAATITMPKEEALAAYREYREHTRDAKDTAVMMGYRALARGKALINVREAIAKAGFDELMRPRFALARAHMPSVRWECFNDSGRFHISQQGQRHGWTFHFGQLLPAKLAWKYHRAVCPYIPPRIRPAESQLHKYWLLWEADWQAVPSDPYLLKRLHGDLFVILAAWDLTPLERAVVSVV